MQILKLENRKQKKLDQLTKPLLSNNTKLNNSDNDFDLSQYKYNNLNSLDNRYSDFSEKEKSDEKREFDKDKLIAFLFLSASKLTKLS